LGKENSLFQQSGGDSGPTSLILMLQVKYNKIKQVK